MVSSNCYEDGFIANQFISRTVNIPIQPYMEIMALKLTRLSFWSLQMETESFEVRFVRTSLLARALGNIPLTFLLVNRLIPALRRRPLTCYGPTPSQSI